MTPRSSFISGATGTTRSIPCTAYSATIHRRSSPPVVAAGEFLEGAAFVSDERLADGIRFLGLFRLGEASLETARQYARVPTVLRRADQLQDVSKADLWIAASALEQAARLATRNVKHFERIPDLKLLVY